MYNVQASASGYYHRRYFKHEEQIQNLHVYERIIPNKCLICKQKNVFLNGSDGVKTIFILYYKYDILLFLLKD